MVSRPSIFNKVAEHAVTSVERATAHFKENALLMGIQSGSVDESVYRATSAAMKYNQLGREQAEKDKKRAEERRFFDLIAQLQNDLAKLEADIARDYGENFALDLLSELKEKGLVNDEEYDRIAKIQNLEEQRKEAARLIQEKRDKGIITDDDLKDNPSIIKDWLDKRDRMKKEYIKEAQSIVDNGRPVNSDNQDLLQEVERLAVEQGVDFSDYVTEKYAQMESENFEQADVSSAPDDGFSFS
jgi:hypothetical protein